LSIALSWVITRVSLEAVGIPPVGVAGWLSIGIPALLVPLTVYPLFRANGRLKQMQAELETAAHTDVLTGLPNRRAFFERACLILDRTSDQRRTVTVMMADIDRFKPINDTYGHDAGDDVLTAVGAVVRRTVATSGAGDWVVARMGGEEFAVIVEGLAPDAIAGLAEAICANARRIDCARRPGSKLGVTLSVGVAFHTPGMEIDDLLKAADGAVYDAKRCGRNRWAFALGDFGEELPTPAIPRIIGQERFARRAAAS
jgi:diguanylate cyclase (GGDEF)-like protein